MRVAALVYLVALGTAVVLAIAAVQAHAGAPCRKGDKCCVPTTLHRCPS